MPPLDSGVSADRKGETGGRKTSGKVNNRHILMIQQKCYMGPKNERYKYVQRRRRDLRPPLHPYVGIPKRDSGGKKPPKALRAQGQGGNQLDGGNAKVKTCCKLKYAANLSKSLILSLEGGEGNKIEEGTNDTAPSPDGVLGRGLRK